MKILLPFILAYRSVLSNPLMAIFTLLSAVQVYNGIQRLQVIRTRRTEWRTEPLRPWKKRVAEDVAFYAAVPISVFIHELFHAFAVWGFGGRIIEFGFFFFWGFVLPDRVFPELWQEWVVSVMGTVGSLTFGLGWWVLFGRNHSSAVRYVAKRVLRFQIFFSLVYYPIFTAVLSFGDWRTIYNFQATPRLASGTAVLHLFVLAFSWRLEKTGWFDMLAFETEQQKSQYESLQSATDTDPEVIQRQIALIETNLRGDSRKQAVQLARQLLEKFPNSAESHLTLARALWKNEEHVPREVLKHAQQAQELGLSKPRQRAFAHQIVGIDAMGRGKFDVANAQFDAGLATAAQAGDSREDLILRAYLHFMKASTLTQQNRNDVASAELQSAIRFAEMAGQTTWAQRLRQRQQLLDKRR